LDQPRRHIAHRFRKVLLEFVNDKGHSVYEEKIQRMAESNGRSLEVSFVQLDLAQPLLALWLSEAPTDMLLIFDEVAVEIVKVIYPCMHPTTRP
jgi:DNA replication licensing factor MCM2